ncbi:alpha/beta hydrolase [Terasakiella sp. A23]|uniref:alpha/beta fold hydrolase n=1 Tax=Terasakiella sp. FCG-A23 TaxID=3080561 RepID=UPI002955A066|nr:alpha/beta hydrolase [Terasakiella sp. A23]MDV7338721.1 alpha/beta hydrolase [Terasakiella sp. A23]
MAKLVFVHGWGFDPSFWDEIIPAFCDHDVQCIDLGFYGNEKTDLPDEAVYITHSMGLAWVLQNANQINGLIAINGFTKFCQADDWPAGVPERMLTRMIRQFDKAPDAVWAQFMTNSGVNDPVWSDTADIQGMKEGLACLLNWDVRDLYTSLQCPKMILSSRNDQIVPEKLSLAAFPEDIIWYKEANHVLVLNQAGETIRHIQRFLDSL